MNIHIMFKTGTGITLWNNCLCCCFHAQHINKHHSQACIFIHLIAAQYVPTHRNSPLLHCIYKHVSSAFHTYMAVCIFLCIKLVSSLCLSALLIHLWISPPKETESLLLLQPAPLLPHTPSHISSSGWVNHRLSFCHPHTHAFTYMLTHTYTHMRSRTHTHTHLLSLDHFPLFPFSSTVSAILLFFYPSSCRRS